MKRLFLAALIAAVASVPASAATLYVGHGIPGKLLGDITNKLPVDVCLVAADGTKSALFPVALNFGEFKEIMADLPAGRYDVEVQVFDSGSCTSTVAAAASIFLGLGENATALAHLTEQGTATVTKYVNDFRPLASDTARLYARHAAAIGDVDVFVNGKGRPVSINDLENPDQEGADLGAGSTYVSISSARGAWRWNGHTNQRSGSRLFSARLDLMEGTAYYAYAVGLPGDDPDTFKVLLQALKVN